MHWPMLEQRERSREPRQRRQTDETSGVFSRLQPTTPREPAVYAYLFTWCDLDEFSSALTRRKWPPKWGSL